MRKPVIVLFCLLSLQHLHAQVSDSTIKLFSKDICNCIDTLDFDKPEAEVKKEVSTCKTMSIANMLNRQLITPEILTDEKQAADLEKRIFSQLAKDCDAIHRLVAAVNKVPAFRPSPADVLVTTFDQASTPGALKLAADLRAAGLRVEWYPEPSKLDRQLKYADANGIR